MNSANVPTAAADQPTAVPIEAAPVSDFPTWDAFPEWHGEDYPDHPDPRARTINNLKFMGLAMHNWAAVNGAFPTAAIHKGDNAGLSWRVAILLYIEQFALYQKFHLDEAWDSPHNASLLNEMPRVYVPVALTDAPTGTTCYQVVVGSGSLFDGDKRVPADIATCSKPRLMIVEAARPVPWTKPEDLLYDDGSLLPRLGGPFENGSYATFANGAVRLLSKAHSPDILHSLITGRRP
jgi:hypothetical protein